MNAQLKPFVPWDCLPSRLSWKEKIGFLAVQFKTVAIDKCPVEHTFGHGLYIRRIRIPKGYLFLGREHLKGHECTLLSGSVILITPSGKEHIDAVKTIHTSPGFHMVLYAVTDVEGQTVHSNPTNSTDIVQLESEIFGSEESMILLGLRVAQQLNLT